MKTLLALEELIRSYNGITALDNFKAVECLKTLKELDRKYNGFGEDTEISTKRMSQEYFEEEICSTVMRDRIYLDFCPISYQIVEQGNNCLLEFKSDKNYCFISDKLIGVLYECVCDILEFGELSENTNWNVNDSIMKIQLQEVSNESNCVMIVNYDDFLCEILQDLNGIRLNKQIEVVINFDMKKLTQMLKRILLAFRSQEIIKMPLPSSKVKKYSEVLGETLMSERYFKVLNSLVK